MVRGPASALATPLAPLQTFRHPLQALLHPVQAVVHPVQAVVHSPPVLSFGAPPAAILATLRPASFPSTAPAGPFGIPPSASAAPAHARPPLVDRLPVVVAFYPSPGST